MMGEDLPFMVGVRGGGIVLCDVAVKKTKRKAFLRLKTKPK